MKKFILKKVSRWQEKHEKNPSGGSHRCLLESVIINFQTFDDKKIPQDGHTGACLNGLSLTCKLLLIEQITGEIDRKICDS